MGMNISCVGGKFEVDARHKEGARQAMLRSLSGEHAYVRSGWRDQPTLELMLADWRWRAKSEEGSDEWNQFGIVGLSFEGEGHGADEQLFQVLAPFVQAGSYLEMTDGDGGYWRWVFDGDTCQTKQATISFE